MRCQLSSKLCAEQGLEQRLLESLDQKLDDFSIARSLNDSSSTAADSASKPVSGSASTSEPSGPSAQDMQQQQQQKNEEDNGQQAAYDRMQVSQSCLLVLLCFPTDIVSWV